MRSTKFYSAVLVFGLIFMAGTLAAQNMKASVDGGIAMYNPCNLDASGAYKSYVSVLGSTQVDYHLNGDQATVHVLFHNDGQDVSLLTDQPSLGSYRLNFEANGAGPVQPSYTVPFHSVWAGQGSGSTFKMDGNVVVTFNADGTPSTGIVYPDPAFSLSCVNQSNTN